MRRGVKLLYAVIWCLLTGHISIAVPDVSNFLTNSRNCSVFTHSCGGKQKHCIPLSWVCDGESDCDDGSDETDCPRCNENEMKCTHECVALGWTCDGDEDCLDGADENPAICLKNENCEYFGAPCLNNPYICINFTSLCDGVVDCPDLSDEGSHCKELVPGYRGQSLCEEMRCEYSCTISPAKTALCYCQEGFMINDADNRTCTRVPVCDILTPCEQHCHSDGKGWSYTCSCDAQFVQNPQHSNLCDPSTLLDDPYLLVSTKNFFQQVDANGRIESTFAKPRATWTIDYNWKKKEACWIKYFDTPPSPAILLCADISNFAAPRSFPVMHDVHAAPQIAIDWVTGNVYFLNSDFQNIFVCNVTEIPVCVTILQQPTLSMLYGLALDPLVGLMFFNDYGKYPKMLRASMDGQNKIAIVTRRIVRPMALSLDIYGKRIYFSDGDIGIIDSVDYNGRHRNNILSSQQNRILSSAYFDGFLYFADITNGAIVRADAWNITDRPAVVIKGNLTDLHAVRFVQPLMQKPDDNNGCARLICSQICLLGSSHSGPTSGTCFCRPGFTLADDGQTCNQPEHQDTFLVYSKENAGEIKGTSLYPIGSKQTTPPFIPVENLQIPRAFDFYRDRNRQDRLVFYQADDYETLHEPALLGGTMHSCNGLAIDWTTDNVYWTDYVYRTINVANFSNAQAIDGSTRLDNYPRISRFEPPKTNRKIVFQEQGLPRSIVLHPSEGLMFWSVVMRAPHSGGIRSAWMNGNNVTTLTLGDGIDVVWPNGLAIDRTRSMLYWVEAYHDRIECIHTNGSNRMVLLTSTTSGFLGYVSNPFAVTFFEGDLDNDDQPGPLIRYLYWSEYRTGDIYRLNIDLAMKNTSHPPSGTVEHVMHDGPPILNVVAFNPSAQTPSNSCVNSRCTEICVPIPVEPFYACLCPENKLPTIDGFSCIEKINYTSPSHCGTDYFECDNGHCISNKWLCDRDNDCKDNSDESPALCTTSTCGEDRFRCNASGMCISSRWVCDREKDCIDGEDESDETCADRTCPAGHYACRTGYCIPDSWRCDADNDCSDGSDEIDNCTYTKCSESEFSCKKGACILPQWVCDSEDDCGDGSDEVNCGLVTPSTAPARCVNPNETPCGNGTKADARCIPRSWYCDGDIDCPDRSDEENCTKTTCPPHQRLCASGRQCIYQSWWCDGEDECNDKSDETNCSCPTVGGYKQIRCLTRAFYAANVCVKRCDGRKECLNEMDEFNCTSHGTCEDAGCSHTCTETDVGFVCSCPKGKELADDERTCQYIQYCSKRGRCSQNCTAELSSYRCSCYDGWHLDQSYPDRSICAFDKPDPPPFLLYCSRHTIKYTVLKTSRVLDSSDAKQKSEILVGGARHILALDFHYEKNYLFYTDVLQDTITRANISYNANDKTLQVNASRVIISRGLATPEGIAVDWIADRIYFVDADLDHIEVADLDGRDRSVLIAGDVDSPRAIAVDPRFGLMFWTDWEADNARVERATMAGTNRTILWKPGPDKSGWPNGLTIDYLENRIYWGDAKIDMIWSAKYDGSDQFVAVYHVDWLSHPFGITTFAHQLIWTEWRTTVIASASKWPGRNATVLELSFNKPFDIKAYHESRQPLRDSQSGIAPANPCSENPCHGLCLIIPGDSPLSLSYKCSCPYIARLAPDGRTCISIDTFLLLSQKYEIRGLSLDNLNYSATYSLSKPYLSVATRLAYQASRDQIYWSDDERQEIRRCYLNGTGVETVVGSDSPKISGLAVDWLRDKVFWTSQEESTSSARISVVSMDGRFKYRLENRTTGSDWSRVRKPRDLTIDVPGGLLYFAADDGIYSVHMDGSLLTKVSAFNVTGLQFFDDFLYCIYNASLFRIDNSDGSTQDLHLAATEFAVASHDKVWIYKAKQGAIYLATRETPSNTDWQVALKRTKTVQPTDMLIFDPALQNITDLWNDPCYVGNGGCEHLCLPVPDDSSRTTCKCTIGYKPSLNNFSECEGLEEFLIYSNDHSLMGIHLNGDEDALVPITDLSLPNGVDFYAENHTIIWIDAGTSSIHASTRDHTSQWLVYSPYGSDEQSSSARLMDERFEGIAVDWIARNIYWTDSGLDLIKVVRMDGKFAYTIKRVGEKLRAIAVHPSLGFLFVSDWGSDASIYRMLLDGSNSTQILKDLGWPNGLTIDHKGHKLFWSDARSDKIYSSDLNGNRQTTIVHSGQSRTYGISFYDGSLYWADSHYEGGSISTCDLRNDCGSSNLLARGLSQDIKNIVVYSSKRQPPLMLGRTKICAHDNGGCEHLCFDLPNAGRVKRNATCKCVHSISDGPSCKPFERYIVFSVRTVLHSINVDNPQDLNEPLPPIEAAMKSVVVMANDYKGKRIFFSDMLQGNIYSFNTTYTGFNIPAPRLVVKGVRIVEGLAYHRGSDALYWTSYNHKSIMRYYLSHPYAGPPRVVVQRQSAKDRLRALVLYECKRPNLIFWTNWNDEGPTILRATTDGQNITKIITTRVTTPNGLAIDAIVEQLYWADAALDKIESCDFDGRNRKVILSEGLQHVFSLAVLGKYLYWSDWRRDEVLRVNKFTGSNPEILRNYSSLNPMGIVAVFDDTCVPNPCRSANIHCQYQCVVSDEGKAVCMCPNGTIADHCEGDELTCGPDHFTCADSSQAEGRPFCIHYELSCDGQPQCPRGEDEDPTHCNQRTCKEEYWRCANNKCIHTDLVCDQTQDCSDGSDEINCSGTKPPCKTGMFTCNNGVCIPMSWKCDRENDCGDNSDESCNETCPRGTFQCSDSGICHPLAYKCDSESDCADGSDEKDCGDRDCLENFFACLSDGHCVPLGWICDGDRDCSDGSDEHSCDHNDQCEGDQLLCKPTGRCLDPSWVCDHDRDCPDGSDEADCEYPQCDNITHFSCPNDKHCLPRDWICDGDKDCIGGYDEKNCGQGISCNLTTHLQCLNGECLPLSKACDGVTDCKDGKRTDEIGCNIAECASRHHCQQICVERIYRYTCACMPGYRLDSKGYACTDINECEESDPYPPCSQSCFNRRGTYACSCAPGYYKDPQDPSSCVARKSDKATIVFANKYYLREMPLDGSSTKLLVSHLRHAVAVDFDWPGQKLYWTDVTSERSVIQRMDLNRSAALNVTDSIETIHKALVHSAHGIAVDWVARNLYWSDKGLDTIEVSKLDGRYRKTLIRSGLDEPRALALNPRRGYLYWSDWGTDPHIGRIGMDGANRSIILHSHASGNVTHRLPGKKLGWPNAITIDYASRKLFWADAKEDYVAYCNFDGSQARVLLERTGNGILAAHVFSMSMFEDRIYWTDWHDQSIHSVHKFRALDGKNDTVLGRSFIHRPMDLKVIHPLRQPMPITPHPCTVNNGECQDLCLISPGGKYRCGCPNNFYLTNDNRSCKSNCSYSEFVCKNHKCIPFWWKCDGVNDCGDHSDEPANCGPYFCRPGQYQCANSTADSSVCISPSGICDGDPECPDRSDERNCDTYVCLSTQFKCRRSTPPRCIPDFQRCDGIHQCDSDEDEFDCPVETCKSNEFRCESLSTSSNRSEPVVHQCRPRAWLCDGDSDCVNGVDEKNCSQHTCNSDEFRCASSGRCLPKKWTCDGETDCADGSDENDKLCNATCDHLEFQCKSGDCISARFRCDNDEDCYDGSDEINCTPRNCTESEFRCVGDERCIPNEFHCDHEEDCGDGSDEFDCKVSCDSNQFRCENPPSCIPRQFVCNGNPDCFNATDEGNCTGDHQKPQCPGYMYQCMDGACVPKHWLCDGQFDCPDSSDEGPACHNFVCPVDRPYRCKNHDICLPFKKLCDGKVDCFDENDDESPKICISYQINHGHTSNSSHCVLWRKQPIASNTGTSHNNVTNGYLCMDNSCTPLTTLCDGVRECKAGEDEHVCLTETCSSKSCSKIEGSICRTLPRQASHGKYQAYCACAPGTQLRMSSTKFLYCADAKECLSMAPCSQMCYDTIRGYHCGCKLGWRKTSVSFCQTDRGEEKPKEPILFIASGSPLLLRKYSQIESIPYPTELGFLGRLTDTVSIGRVAAAPVDDHVFWIDAKLGSIFEYKNKAASTVWAVVPGTMLTGIAFNWKTNTLFWTDAGHGSVSILQLTTEESSRKRRSTPVKDIVLLDSKNSKLVWPLDVALCLETDIMFVADGGNNETGPFILRYDIISSSTRTVIKASEGVEWPISLAVDSLARRLYWTDLKLGSIFSINYDGSNKRLVRQFDGVRPSTIQLYGDYLFCTTYLTNEVYRINKLSHVLSPGPEIVPLDLISDSAIPDESTRRKDFYRISQSSTNVAVAVLDTKTYKEVAAIQSKAKEDCQWCLDANSPGICMSHTSKSYSCMCPSYILPLPANNTRLVPCPCNECKADQVCKYGKCYTKSSKIMASSPVVPVVVGILAAVVIVIAGIIIYKNRNLMPGWKHRRPTSGTDTNGVTYQELKANDAEITGALTSPGSSLDRDSNEISPSPEKKFPDHENGIDNTMGNGKSPAYDRIFFTPGTETHCERAQLLLEDELSPQEHYGEDEDDPSVPKEAKKESDVV
ncbi:prolow-density lipoprotein receptor-related protein 1-like isoform X2 [Clavelina lepadiformis]|uniref:prolow-density lipoprotein receptor-related protein 1-like isoform X2 n=1 Tax=Clavelina lepadiformis TaxID=159417 RepID=UPI004042B912